MELTRRDALVALATVGASATAGCETGRTVTEPRSDSASDAPDPDLLGTLTAASEVLYPSAVSGHRGFVETYVLGRIESRDGYRKNVAATAAELDATAQDWYGSPFRELDRTTRDEILRGLGADAADPDPEGAFTERVRYYVVNELLYAFYASPTGGRLVGIENPIGHPGGRQSYQRPSMPGNDGNGGWNDG